MAAVPSLPDGGEYRVVLVPATAAADAGAFPAGSFVLPAGTTLSSAPLPPPDLGGVDPATGLPSAAGDAYGGLGPLHLGEGGAGLVEAFSAHALLAPFGPEGADAYYGPLDTAQFAAAAGLLPPLPPPEEQAPLPPPEEQAPLPPPLPLVRPRTLTPLAHATATRTHALTQRRAAFRRKPRPKKDYVRDEARHVYLTASVAELTGRRTYPCQLCGRSTANPPALRRHLTVHGDAGARALAAMDAAAAAAAASAAAAAAVDGRTQPEPRYYCPSPDCLHNPGPEGGGAGAYPFKTLRIARVHYAQTHAASAQELTCARCGRCYTQPLRLRAHERRCGERHRCSCAAWFTERRSLLNHLRLYGDHADAGSVDALGRDLPQPGGEDEEEEEEGDGDEAAEQ